MTSTLHPKSTVATRTLTTRRPQFHYPEKLSRRHFAADDLFSSHLVAVLSAIIPEGEQFVVDAVKRYRADIIDPDLRRQANAFVGQESMHQREHARLNAVLQETGYPMGAIARVGTGMRAIGRRLPRSTQLACTAAIEHWTAVLAEFALAKDRPGSAYTDDEVGAFMTWHLIEELEHKSVAFDVMQALGTSERQRIRAMRVLIALVAPGLAISMAMSLAKDPAAWNPRNLMRSRRWNQENSALTEDGFKEGIGTWGRVGFHPDERDHRELLERCRETAFGPGSIVDLRSRRPVA